MNEIHNCQITIDHVSLVWFKLCFLNCNLKFWFFSFFFWSVFNNIAFLFWVFFHTKNITHRITFIAINKVNLFEFTTNLITILRRYIYILFFIIFRSRKYQIVVHFKNLVFFILKSLIFFVKINQIRLLNKKF